MDKTFYYEYMVNHLLHLEEKEKDVRKYFREEGIPEAEIDQLLDEYHSALMLSKAYNDNHWPSISLENDLENKGWPHSAVVSIINKYKIEIREDLSTILGYDNTTDESLSKSELKVVLLIIAVFVGVICILWIALGVDLPNFKNIRPEDVVHSILKSISPKFLLLLLIGIIAFIIRIIRKLLQKLFK